jgi:hypothetical protein
VIVDTKINVIVDTKINATATNINATAAPTLTLTPSLEVASSETVASSEMVASLERTTTGLASGKITRVIQYK